MSSWWERWLMQRMGCFSIDRERTDRAAYRQAVEILRHRRHPLVIFPEGDIYHSSDRVMPFREGAAAIALSAAKHGSRPISVVPCAVKFWYVDDPLPELESLMTQLERRILLSRFQANRSKIASIDLQKRCSPSRKSNTVEGQSRRTP